MIDAHELLQRLADRGLTLGSVESLTGGLFGATICSVPGASAVYKGGLITYVAEEKEALAGVKKEDVEKFGVVSPEVATEMAIGGAKTLKVDVCVSCTGNAGPTVEKGGKPVGCVYLGLSYQGNVWMVPLQLQGSRNEIRQQAVDTMINLAASLFPEVIQK